MSKGILYNPPKPENEKIINKKINKTGIRIGITYLDTDKYGLKDLYRSARGKSKYIDDFNSFIIKAREMDDIGDVIKNFSSHIKGKNDDITSKKKIEDLNKKYNIEVDHLIHLHCFIGGKGEFVIHGFQVDNIFEIVWLDPEHKVHKV